MSSLPIIFSRLVTACCMGLGTVASSRMTPSTRIRTSMSSRRGSKWRSDAPSASAVASSELTRVTVDVLAASVLISLLRSSSDASSLSSMISCSEGRYARAIASSICPRSATAIRKLEPSAKRRSSAVARFVGSVTARRGVPSSRMRRGSASYRRASSSGSRAIACLSSSATSRSTNSSSYCSASAPAIARSVVKPSETAISPRRRLEEPFSSSTRRSCSSVRMPPSTSNWPSGIHPSPGSGVLMRSLSAGAPRS